MFDSLFFCGTLTSRRGSHTPFVQTGTETPDTGVEEVKPNPGSSWEGCSGGMDAGVGDENVEVSPTPHSIGDPPIAPHVCCCCQMD